MRMGRRTVLKGGAIAGSIIAAPAAVRARQTPSIAVFDSRERISVAFAKRQLGPAIDVAQEDSAFWRRLSRIAKSQTVEGLTSWSDWVIVRGLLEENGLRMKAEAKAGTLFRWSMA